MTTDITPLLPFQEAGLTIAPREWTLSMPSIPQGSSPSVRHGISKSERWRLRCVGSIICIAAFVGVAALCLSKPEAVLPCLLLELPATAVLLLLWRLKPGSALLADKIRRRLTSGQYEVSAHVAWLNTDGLAMICSAMEYGSMGGTHGYEYPEYLHTTLTEAYSPLELEPHGGDPWAEYAHRRDALRWQCEQLKWLREIGQTHRRPAAPELRHWVAVYGPRDAQLTAFVRSLIPLAESSDDSTMALRCAEHARMEAALSRKRMDDHLEVLRNNRRYHPAPVTTVSAPSCTDWLAEQQAARDRAEAALRQARRVAAALADARADFESRGEWHQAEVVSEREKHVLKAIAEHERYRNF